jgi:hypothetical protein
VTLHDSTKLDVLQDRLEELPQPLVVSASVQQISVACCYRPSCGQAEAAYVQHNRAIRRLRCFKAVGVVGQAVLSSWLSTLRLNSPQGCLKGVCCSGVCVC